MVSDPDTVFVNLRIDEESAFVSSQSKTEPLSYQGFFLDIILHVFFLIILGSWTWHKTLLVVLIALCIIGIILALVFLIIGKKKTKKNNQSQQSATKLPGKKGISPNPEYSPVPTSV